ncbi:MAG: hypothetical protein ACPIOQ_47475 [Promethearchaeia archaeon]
MLDPVDGSLSPHKISGVLDAEKSFQGSHRMESLQNPGSTPVPKKASRSKQLQIQLKSLYSQKYQDEVSMEREGQAVGAKTTVAGRTQP